MLRVIEVANMLGVSKVTIYKKMKKLDQLKPYITKKKNITYIKKEGIPIIKESLEKFQTDHTEIEIKKQMIETINQLEEYKSTLKQQLNVKINHIEKKDAQLRNLKKIIDFNKQRLKLIKKIYN